MERPGRRTALDLVPRYRDQGYGPEQVAQRRAWVEERTGARLDHVGAASTPSGEMRGNVENPIGAAQVPLGVAGPLEIHGEHAAGVFYVPLATTEGALVRSYERGMLALTRAGGVTVRLERDENCICPVFACADPAAASDLAGALAARGDELREVAEATTRHGRLLRVEARVVGHRVFATFRWSTGDAHGMNLIVRGTDAACRWLVERGVAEEFLLFSGLSSEKRASGALLAGGKGKRVVAAARLPAAVVRRVLDTTPTAIDRMWRATVIGHQQAGALGYNGQVANALAALFIACGQDVANVTNAAVAVTEFEAVGEEELLASVTLPSLTVATVGGGTGLGTARECLEMLGCAGDGGARRFAEVVAATVLAGEISMAAAIASGQMAAAHETYGRNRPPARRGEDR